MVPFYPDKNSCAFSWMPLTGVRESGKSGRRAGIPRRRRLSALRRRMRGQLAECPFFLGAQRVPDVTFHLKAAVKGPEGIRGPAAAGRQVRIEFVEDLIVDVVGELRDGHEIAVRQDGEAADAVRAAKQTAEAAAGKEDFAFAEEAVGAVRGGEPEPVDFRRLIAGALAAEQDGLSGDGDLVDVAAMLIPVQKLAVRREQESGAGVIRQLAEVGQDDAGRWRRRNCAQDCNQRYTGSRLGRVTPGQAAFHVDPVEPVRSSRSAGHLHEQDFPPAVPVDVLDDGALALTREGGAVGAFVQCVFELKAPDLMLLVIQGGEEASVNGKRNGFGGAEQPVMLSQVVGESDQQEQRHDPPGSEANLAALPPRDGTLALRKPAAEFLGVGGDPAMGVRRPLDGQAGLALPHLHSAHAGVEEGRDLLPRVEPVTTFGGSRHDSPPSGECLHIE